MHGENGLKKKRGAAAQDEAEPKRAGFEYKRLILALTTTMATVRKAAGISLIALGTVWLTLWASMMLRSPLPIPGFILRRLGSFAYYVDPVVAPISGLVFLTGGVVLLWRRQRVRHS